MPVKGKPNKYNSNSNGNKHVLKVLVLFPGPQAPPLQIHCNGLRLIHIEPLNWPNQQPELYALYEQKQATRIIQYDSMNTIQGKPMEIPLYQRKIDTM